jgi:hypothetical protein
MFTFYIFCKSSKIEKRANKQTREQTRKQTNEREEKKRTDEAQKEKEESSTTIKSKHLTFSFRRFPTGPFERDRLSIHTGF